MGDPKKFIPVAGLALLLTPVLFSAAPAVFSAAAEEQDPEPQEGAVAMVDGENFTVFEEALGAWQAGSALTLLADAETQETISVSGEKTLYLNEFALSLAEGGSGSVLKVVGKLTLYGTGRITGGNAEQGGGVYVDSRGTFTMNGGEISGNTATLDGGGIYVTGSCALSGKATVTGNTDGAGNDSNIFLTYGNKLHVSNFSGTAGVTTAADSLYKDDRDIFADGDGSGTFSADDKRYVAENGRLAVAPLSSIEATYSGEKVFPTTSLERLKELVEVTGVNVNGVPYAGELSFSLSGRLTVATCPVTVTATGENGEEARAQIEIAVQKPRILSLSVIAPDYPPKLYFDSPLSLLTEDGGYTFKGMYDDGYERPICATPEETTEKCGEIYIDDYYTLSGDLSSHENGKAAIKVKVGEKELEFFVTVSKYEVSVTEADIAALSVKEGNAVDARDFVPSLPEGIAVLATVGGTPLNAAALPADVYHVELSFSVSDRENYEDILSVFTTSLTVLRRAITGRTEGMEYSATKEEGLPPEWKFGVKDVTDSVTVKPEGSLEARRVYELTLQQDGIVVEDAGELTVSLPVAEELREKEIKLFWVDADGNLEEVGAVREGDCLVFSATSFSHTRYVLAVETASRAYLILSIVFGAACAAGAAAILFYLVFKRKMKL